MDGHQAPVMPSIIKVTDMYSMCLFLLHARSVVFCFSKEKSGKLDKGVKHILSILRIHH